MSLEVKVTGSRWVRIRWSLWVRKKDSVRLDLVQGQDNVTGGQGNGFSLGQDKTVTVGQEKKTQYVSI